MYIYIIMLMQQFSNIEEYVKYVLQIFVHIICNHKNICIHFLLLNHGFILHVMYITILLKLYRKSIFITSLYLHEMLNSVIFFINNAFWNLQY
jgi:hypothetical protein